jgi:hypothetical protein
MLAAMQQASEGTIANTDLILGCQPCHVIWCSQHRAGDGQLIQLSMAQAAKMGISATQAFNDLVTGVGRLSPDDLDNLGVTVQAEKAYSRSMLRRLARLPTQLNADRTAASIPERNDGSCAQRSAGSGHCGR